MTWQRTIMVILFVRWWTWNEAEDVEQYPTNNASVKTLITYLIPKRKIISLFCISYLTFLHIAHNWQNNDFVYHGMNLLQNRWWEYFGLKFWKIHDCSRFVLYLCNDHVICHTNVWFLLFLFPLSSFNNFLLMLLAFIWHHQ